MVVTPPPPPPPTQPSQPLKVLGRSELSGSSANPNSRNVQPLGPTHQTQPHAAGARVRTGARPQGATPIFDLNPPRRLAPAKALFLACVLGIVTGGIALAIAFNGEGPQAHAGEVQALSTISPAAAQTSPHENGEIPAKALKEIGDGYQLTKPAAKAFKTLTKELTAAGHSYTINSAYRTIEEQEQLVSDLGRLEDGGLAAEVGTSEHGLGTAVDLTLDWDALTWMRDNAASFGFAETISDEPWHWNYIGEA